MWMVATQDTLDPGVGGVVRQECQGDTGSSLRRLNGRNDACVRLRKICNGKRPQTSGRIDWNARARGPEAQAGSRSVHAGEQASQRYFSSAFPVGRMFVDVLPISNPLSHSRQASDHSGGCRERGRLDGKPLQ